MTKEHYQIALLLTAALAVYFATRKKSCVQSTFTASPTVSSIMMPNGAVIDGPPSITDAINAAAQTNDGPLIVY